MIVSVPIFEQPYLITTYSPECVEKLSEKGFECRSGRVFGPSMGAKTGPTGRFVHLRGRVSGASGTFRTVSCTEFFEVRMGSVQHPCCRGVPNATKRLSKTRLTSSYLPTLRAVAGCASGSTRPNRCPVFGTGFKASTIYY